MPYSDKSSQKSLSKDLDNVLEWLTSISDHMFESICKEYSSDEYMNLITIAKDCFKSEDDESSQMGDNEILEFQKEIIDDLKTYVSDTKESESSSETYDTSNCAFHVPEHLKYAVNLISSKDTLIPLIKNLHKDNILNDLFNYVEIDIRRKNECE